MNLEKGYLSTYRSKTKVVRIACLWKETIVALNKLPRDSDFVFRSPMGRRHNADTIRWAFRGLRKEAMLDSVKFNQIRDGAYSAACNTHGMNAQTAEWLAGHSTGMKDAYVKRTPESTREACEAIHREYMERAISVHVRIVRREKHAQVGRDS